MADILLPNYDNCLLNLMASIRRHYGLPTTYKTNSIADLELAKNYKNVIVLLLDGLGNKIIEKNLPKNSFIAKTVVSQMTTVFPPTTAAATTAVQTTISPIEAGWLGWHQYFKEIDHDLVMFKNYGYFDESYVPSTNVISAAVNYESIVETLKNKGIKTADLFPAFKVGGAENFPEFCSRILKFCQGDERKFMYAYWDDPDSSMHEYGTSSDYVKNIIQDLNSNLEKMASSLDDDTIIFLIADHGLIDVEPIDLYEYKDLVDTLLRLPSLDSRALSLWVKPGQNANFERLFKKYFSKAFVLYTHEQVMKMQLFGRGTPHPRAEDFIGDYMAIATGNYYMESRDPKIVSPFIFKANHSGLTVDEMSIPLGIIRHQ